MFFITYYFFNEKSIARSHKKLLNGSYFHKIIRNEGELGKLKNLELFVVLKN